MSVHNGLLQIFGSWRAGETAEKNPMHNAESLRPTLRILGTRGVPAAHGGFETFAENLAIHLVEQGWRVIVYCQEEGSGPIHQDVWQDVERVHVSAGLSGVAATMLFDWKATLHAAAHRDLCLTLGYNTALFCSWLRFKGVRNIINMDGIEWSRAKWNALGKAWFWLNERAGCWLGDHLIADHPQIKEHLATRVSTHKITTIPYGAEAVVDAPEALVRAFGLEPRRYLTLIARAEPENSLLEVVQGFASQPRDMHLAVLGRYDFEHNAYHRAIRQAANDKVRFLGAIYDKPTVQALRFHSAAYVHGHQVGGTNPSLVEALGAGNAVIAHDNRFNRWVAEDGALYFDGATGFSQALDALLLDASRLRQLSLNSRRRFEAHFTWPLILGKYEHLLSAWVRSAAVH